MSTNPPRIAFASLNPNNLGTVRKLNSVLFPIRYSEKFYQEIIQPEVEDFCKLGTSWLLCSTRSILNTISWKFITMMFQYVLVFRMVHHVYMRSLHKVGTICCRLENKDDKIDLYLMTMGVLAVGDVY